MKIRRELGQVLRNCKKNDLSIKYKIIVKTLETFEYKPKNCKAINDSLNQRDEHVGKFRKSSWLDTYILIFTSSLDLRSFPISFHFFI